MPKIVTVPEDVKIKDMSTNEETGVVISFRQFVMQTLLNHPVWSKDIESIRAGSDVADAIEHVAEGKVSFPSSVYERLCQAAKDPSAWQFDISSRGGPRQFGTLRGGGLIQVLPFVDAILKAEG